jgi:hypothetical protein
VRSDARGWPAIKPAARWIAVAILFAGLNALAQTTAADPRKDGTDGNSRQDGNTQRASTSDPAASPAMPPIVQPPARSRETASADSNLFDSLSRLVRIAPALPLVVVLVIVGGVVASAYFAREAAAKRTLRDEPTRPLVAKPSTKRAKKSRGQSKRSKHEQRAAQVAAAQAAAAESLAKSVTKAARPASKPQTHAAPAKSVPAPMAQRLPNEPPGPATEQNLLLSSLELDPLHQRIRDRYIGASFPGIVKSSRDLSKTVEVIKSARLCYEAGRPEQSCELLHLAIEQVPHERALWLAWLEVLFLTRQETRYVKVANSFHQTLPYDPDWAHVARLGLQLDPEHKSFLFARTAAGDPEHGSYLQHWQNWLQSGGDLQGEAAAADFHYRMQSRLTQQ